MQRASQKMRWEFVHTLLEHLPAQINGREWSWFHDGQPFAKRLMRYGATLGRIAEMDCNGPSMPNDLTPEQYNKIQARWGRYMEKMHAKESRIERKVTELCAEFECKPVFQGDPRGNVLKIQTPDGYTNDWGREGICVPTS